MMSTWTNRIESWSRKSFSAGNHAVTSIHTIDSPWLAGKDGLVSTFKDKINEHLFCISSLKPKTEHTNDAKSHSF